jgi:hypothetical protein
MSSKTLLPRRTLKGPSARSGHSRRPHDPTGRGAADERCSRAPRDVLLVSSDGLWRAERSGPLPTMLPIKFVKRPHEGTLPRPHESVLLHRRQVDLVEPPGRLTCGGLALRRERTLDPIRAFHQIRGLREQARDGEARTSHLSPLRSLKPEGAPLTHRGTLITAWPVRARR